MGCCHLHTSTPQILSRIPTNKPSQLSLFSSAQPKFRINNQNQNQPPPPISTTTVTQRQPPIPETDAYSVEFRTLGGCKLGISRYPDFEYNDEGGTGSGTGLKIVDGDLDGEVLVNFDLETLYIPPLTNATTRFLGLPLPPFLKIDIVPELFRGIINQKSGKVDLEFRAKFLFSIGSIYKAPPLLVETVNIRGVKGNTEKWERGESE
ncbi:hypothetical protein CsSME_00029102 [Camellia sinensis var. sinensis]